MSGKMLFFYLDIENNINIEFVKDGFEYDFKKLSNYLKDDYTSTRNKALMKKLHVENKKDMIRNLEKISCLKGRIATNYENLDDIDHFKISFDDLRNIKNLTYMKTEKIDDVDILNLIIEDNNRIDRPRQQYDIVVNGITHLDVSKLVFYNFDNIIENIPLIKTQVTAHKYSMNELVNQIKYANKYEIDYRYVGSGKKENDITGFSQNK